MALAHHDQQEHALQQAEASKRAQASSVRRHASSSPLPSGHDTSGELVGKLLAETDDAERQFVEHKEGRAGLEARLAAARHTRRQAETELASLQKRTGLISSTAEQAQKTLATALDVAEQLTTMDDRFAEVCLMAMLRYS